MLRISVTAPAVVSLCVLAACSSSGSGKANVESVDLGAVPVFADGTPIEPSDFNGKTFPFYFVEGFDDGPNAMLRRGEGIVVVSSDGNSLTLVIDGGVSIDLVRESGSLFEVATDTGNFFSVDDLGALRTVRLDDEDFRTIADIAGGFGFQTPSDLMPTGGSVTYNSDGFGRIILNQNGDDAIAALDSDDGVTLFVDFSRRSIEGVLFNGSGLVDLDGDTEIDDRLTLEASLVGGRISGGTFDGRVTGRAAVEIDGLGDPVNLNPSFFNTDVDGAFFGNDAGRIAGTYEGDYSSSGPDGSFVGYFDVGAD